MCESGDDQRQHPGACCQPLPRMCPTPRSAAANGTTVPSKADVQKLTDLICSDPEAAGDQIRTSVEKGGKAAQVGVRQHTEGPLVLLPSWLSFHAYSYCASIGIQECANAL